MSESDDGPGQREVAYRVFAAEYDDADFDFSEGDDERSPNYVITPTGARVNRLFAVGVLTEVEQVSEDVLRARVVDPTGAFVLYAGQYQPDEQAFLERADPPMFVAVTGKARTFSPDDSEQIYTSVRPESINEVDAETRDRWTVQAAEETLYRVGHAARALSMDKRGDELADTLRARGIEESLAAGIPLAIDHYGTTPTYLDAVREMALDGARVVAGEREEVRELDVAPGQAGDVTVKNLVAHLDDVTTVPAAMADETDPAKSDASTTATAAEPSEGDATVTTSEDGQTETAREREAAASEETATATGEMDAATAEETTATAADEPATTSPDETGAGESTETTEAEGTTEAGGVAETDEVMETSEVSETDDVTDPGDFDPEEFELEEETRKEIEEEYGTEFQTGTEVDDPGEADIETPAVDEGEPGVEESGATEATGPDQPTTETEASSPEATEPVETAQEGTDSAAPEPTEPTTTETGDATVEASKAPEEKAVDEPDDLVGAVVDVMEELDDGDGADRDELVDTVTGRYGTPAGEVEEAIQQALMDGKCYEPDDTSVKPI